MFRLLIVFLVLGLSLYLVLFRQTDGKGEVIYQQNLDKANNLEQQMLEETQKQLEEIEKQAQ